MLVTFDGATSPDPVPVASQNATDLDFRGARRLTGREELVWYTVAAVTYILAGMWQKFLLNWIIGPAWLVAVVCIGPVVADRVARSRDRR